MSASKVPALTLKNGTQTVENACIIDCLIQHSGTNEKDKNHATDENE